MLCGYFIPLSYSTLQIYKVVNIEKFEIPPRLKSGLSDNKNNNLYYYEKKYFDIYNIIKF